MSDKIKYLNCEECDNNTFFLRRQNEEIEVICIKCGDDTRLHDAISEEVKK